MHVCMCLCIAGVPGWGLTVMGVGAVRGRRATNRNSSRRMRELRQGQLEKAKQEVHALLENNAQLAMQLSSLQAAPPPQSPRPRTDAVANSTIRELKELLGLAMDANRTLQARLEAYEVLRPPIC